MGDEMTTPGWYADSEGVEWYWDGKRLHDEPRPAGAPRVTNEPTPPGWYPDPNNPSNKIYWDGTAWRTNPASNAMSPNKSPAVAIGVLLLAVIGVVMSMQSVSLMTGSGLIWTGAAVVAAATAASFFLHAASWVRVVAALLLVLALGNAIYIEHQMSIKRDEITRMFDK
jgi:Protein of unknown function (DUF2510)